MSHNANFYHSQQSLKQMKAEDLAQEKQDWEEWKALAKALGLSFVMGLGFGFVMGMYLNG